MDEVPIHLPPLYNTNHYNNPPIYPIENSQQEALQAPRTR